MYTHIFVWPTLIFYAALKTATKSIVVKFLMHCMLFYIEYRGPLMRWGHGRGCCGMFHFHCFIKTCFRSCMLCFLVTFYFLRLIINSNVKYWTMTKTTYTVYQFGLLTQLHLHHSETKVNVFFLTNYSTEMHI